MYFSSIYFIFCLASTGYSNYCVFQKILFHTLLSNYLLFGSLCSSEVSVSYIVKQVLIIRTNVYFSRI